MRFLIWILYYNIQQKYLTPLMKPDYKSLIFYKVSVRPL